MKKLLAINILLLSFVGTAHAQVGDSFKTDTWCQSNYGANFVYDASRDTCKDKNYVNQSTNTATNYNCSTGQIYSSTGNNGAGGCVADPNSSDVNSQSTSGSNSINSSGSIGPNQTTPTPAATPTASSNSGRLIYTPLEPLPGGDNAGNTTYNSLSAYLNLMFNILLSIGAMIAVVSLVFAGITYMISEVVDKKAAARRRITASFIGLGLLLTSWLILYTINPNLLKLCIFKLDAQCGGTSPSGINGPNASATTPNPTPNPQELQQQEATCKAKGPTYAFYVDTSGTSCYDLNY